MRFSAVLVLLCSTLSAQIKAQDFNKVWEVKTGVNISKDVSFDEEYNSSTGLVNLPFFGITHYSKANEKMWLAIGVEYLKIGDTYNYYTGINRQRTDVDIYVRTLKVPFALTFFNPSKESVSPFFKIGPSFDFILGQSIIEPDDPLNNPDGFRENIDQGSVDLPVNLCFHASVGLLLNSNNTHLSIETRYTRFITKFFPNSTFQSFDVSLGLWFGKK